MGPDLEFDLNLKGSGDVWRLSYRTEKMGFVLRVFAVINGL